LILKKLDFCILISLTYDCTVDTFCASCLTGGSSFSDWTAVSDSRFSVSGLPKSDSGLDNVSLKRDSGIK